MKKAYIYTRVSSNEQAEKGKSIETQEKICTRWAKENEYSIAGVYKDEGRTATNLNRPALQDMLADCQDTENNISAILVQDTDRLARDTLGHLTVKSSLKKNDIKVISISQPLIDDSPEGNFIDTVLAATNALQSQITGRKTKKVLLERARNGLYPGGMIPIGYKNIDNPNPKSQIDKRITVIDKEEAPHVRKAFQMYADQSKAGGDIAKYLNKKGLRSLKGNKIHKSRIYTMFRNPFYIGKFKWAGKIFDGKHKPIVSKKLFDKVNDMIEENNQNACRKRKHNFLLSGLLFHSETGERYYAEKHTKKNDQEYFFYFPKNNSKGNYVECDILEEQVALLFDDIKLRPEYVEYVLDLTEKMIKERQDNQDQDRKRFEREKRKIQKAMRELEDSRFIKRNISDQRFTSIYSRYEEQLNNINDQINEETKDYSEGIAQIREILDLAENIGSAYRRASKKIKKRYLNLFFERLLVDEDEITDFELKPEVETPIQQGSVRVSPKWLREQDSNLQPVD